jgi:hypothetical protein
MAGPESEQERSAERIRRDLEARGVPAGVSRALSARLVGLTLSLAPDAYDAILSGVAVAYGVQSPLDEVREHLASLDEVERLMGGFVDELQKLEEALETLAAYVTRLRATSSPPRGRAVH